MIPTLHLVPKLCLGTHFWKLRFVFRRLKDKQERVIVSHLSAKQSFAKCVPKRSLGTR
jgi:hypothetical protein